jgi:hypothetical protein
MEAIMTKKTQAENGTSVPKKRPTKVTVRFPEGALDKLKRTVLHAQRSDPAITLTSVLGWGCELVIEELEKKYGLVPESEEDVKLRRGRRLRVG